MKLTKGQITAIAHVKGHDLTKSPQDCPACKSLRARVVKRVHKRLSKKERG